MELLHFNARWVIPIGYWSKVGDEYESVVLNGTWWDVEWDDGLNMYCTKNTNDYGAVRRDIRNPQVYYPLVEQ